MPQAAIPTKEKIQVEVDFKLGFLDVAIFICSFFSSSQIFIGLTYPGPVLGIIVLVTKFSRVGGVGPDQRGTLNPSQGSLKHWFHLKVNLFRFQMFDVKLSSLINPKEYNSSHIGEDN